MANTRDVRDMSDKQVEERIVRMWPAAVIQPLIVQILLACEKGVECPRRRFKTFRAAVP